MFVTNLECAKACWFCVQGPCITSVSVLNTCEATPIALKKFAFPAGSMSSWYKNDTDIDISLGDSYCDIFMLHWMAEWQDTFV